MKRCRKRSTVLWGIPSASGNPLYGCLGFIQSAGLCSIGLTGNTCRLSPNQISTTMGRRRRLERAEDGIWLIYANDCLTNVRLTVLL